MDAKDIGILRCLGMQPWAEQRLRADERVPAAIATRLGLRADLVRDRISRMEDAGVISGYEIYPNFRLLDMQQTTFHYRLAAETMKGEAIDRALRFDGVVGVYNYLGPQLCMDICYRTEQECRRRLEVLGDYIGNRDAIRWIERHPPEPARSLDQLDWRIIQCLRGDARRSLEDVSAELEVSLRTIRRRFAKLRDDGSTDIVPRINPAQIEGTLLAQLIVHMASDTGISARAEVRQALAEHLLMAMTPPDERLDAIGTLLLVPSVGKLESLRRDLERRPDVTSVWAMLPSGIRHDPSWIDEAIEQKVQQALADKGR